MKVLFLFSLGFDTPNPSYHLMKAMIEDTLAAGISVHIIESHTTGQCEDIPTEFRTHRNLTYDIINCKVINKSAFVKRYIDGFIYALRCSQFIKNVQDYDVIYVQSCPTVLYNVLIAKKHAKKRPIIYSIQDMFPGSSIYSGVMPRKWMQKFFYRLQKIAYKKADLITVISEDMKNKVIEQGVSPDKIQVIVNWYDDKSVHEVAWKENRFVKKYKLSQDLFCVQYAGTMGYVFDYKMVLDAAELLRDYKDIEFHMIGQGSQKEAFMLDAKQRHLGNIIFFPLEPQAMVSDVYSACSICLIPLKKGIIGNSVPSKAGLLMACNRTIVNSVDDDSEYYRMFHDNEMGISASNDDPRAVANAILDLYNNKEKRDRLAKNGQIFGKTYYSRSKNTNKLNDIFLNFSNTYCRKV